jgi:hypothetical protein
VKSGNFNNAAGILNNNGDYVYGSLKENGNKISVGDYLEFEQSVRVTGDILPQNFYLKTQLDRGLDLDISTLEIEKNGGKQFPIYLDNANNADYIKNLYNSQFIISRINQSGNQLKNVKFMINQSLDLTKDQKITGMNGKVYLQLQNDTQVYGSK